MKKLAFFILAFLLLAAASYFLLVRSPAENSGPVPDLVALAPREAEWIAFLDLVAWRSSPMLEQLRKLAPAVQEDPEYRSFVNETGFDYVRDLDRAVLALLPVPSTGAPMSGSYQPLAIAEGRFHRDRITTRALRNGSRENHQGQEVLVVREPSAQRASGPAAGHVLVTFLTANRIALADAGENAGSAARARSLILEVARPQSSASLSPLAQRVARVSGAPFFLVGQTAALQQFNQVLKRAGPLAAQAAELLSNIDWLTVAARPEQDRIRVSILSECKSAWQATQLGLLLDGLLVLARSAMRDPQTRKGLSARDLEQLEAVLATVYVETRGEVVELRLEVSAEALALVAAGSAETSSREQREEGNSQSAPAVVPDRPSRK